MNTLELLSTITQSGLSIRLLDGALIVKPSPLVTPEVGALIRAHKQSLLSILERSTDLQSCQQCGSRLLAIPTFDGYENFECLQCDRCAGCRKVTR